MRCVWLGVVAVLIALACGPAQVAEPWVEWDSRSSEAQSQRAMELGFRQLRVVCVALKGRPPYVHIEGRPISQLIEKRRSVGWRGGGSTYHVDVPVRVYLNPGEYWSGLDPVDEFCPGFSFDWRDYHVVEE